MNEWDKYSTVIEDALHIQIMLSDKKPNIDEPFYITGIRHSVNEYILFSHIRATTYLRLSFVKKKNVESHWKY